MGILGPWLDGYLRPLVGWVS